MTGMLTGMTHSGVTEAAAIMDPTDALCVRCGEGRDRSIGAWYCGLAGTSVKGGSTTCRCEACGEGGAGVHGVLEGCVCHAV